LSFNRSDLAAYGLDPEKIPVHVAVIMDGNGRWAKKRFQNRTTGHTKGVQTVRKIVEVSRRVGLKYLTLYAFSTENWNRPVLEVKALMKLLQNFLVSEREEMLQHNIRLNVIGQTERLSDAVQLELKKSLDLTCENDGLVLNLALSYGGRSEITRMVQKIAGEVRDSHMTVDDITDSRISDYLYTHDIPDPDILIRTSGEMRISNFLLWQIAYSEIFVTDTLWPDFSESEFIEILKEYQMRDRRFGEVKP